MRVALPTVRCIPVAVLFAVLSCCGCSKQVAVTGTVTYPDGTYLGVGQVVFTDDVLAFRGAVDPKTGTYRLGGVKDGDGVLPGKYKVYLMDTDASETLPNGATRIVSHVARKFMDPETSGLTCEVDGKKVFSFTVERP